MDRPAPESASIAAGAIPALASTLTCPVCGHASAETMPTDACLFFWHCPACGTRSKPKAGDCCVFCSYGTIPCPPVQADRGCCGV